MNICIWKIYDNETRAWNTGCGKTHHFTQHFTPVEIGFKACPYCGDRLSQDTTGYIPRYDHHNGEHRRIADRYGT